MKKLLALVLAFAMILTMVNLPLVISAEDITENVATVYVASTGNDETGDGSEANPYASLSKAMAVIEADATAEEGKIIVKDNINFTASNHTKMITISGAEATVVVDGQSRDTYYTLNGPTTFENITNKQLSFYTAGSKLVIGKNVTNSAAATYILGKNGTTTTNGEDLYISTCQKDGYYAWRSVYVGNYTGYTANGDVNVYI